MGFDKSDNSSHVQSQNEIFSCLRMKNNIIKCAKKCAKINNTLINTDKYVNTTIQK